MSRTFCCCIPVRFGVILVSVLGFALGAFVTIGAIYEIVNIPSGTGTTSDKVSYGLVIAIYGLLALFSFLGFIGVLARNRGLVLSPFTVLIGHILLSMASGIWFLVNNTSTIINSCVNLGQTDADGNPITVDRSTCSAAATTYKVVAVLVLVLVWLTEIGFAAVVRSYAKPLEEEDRMPKSYA